MGKRGPKPGQVKEPRAPIGYHELLPGCPGHVFVNAAVKKLVPVQSQRSLVDLFEGRASYSAIRHWRYGRRHVPQWAVEMLRAKALQAAKPALLLAELAPTIPAAPGLGWNKNATRGIGEWRAKQNLQKRD